MTTKEENKDAEGNHITHKGSLFFPLPNGKAMLYKLEGTATEPQARLVISGVSGVF